MKRNYWCLFLLLSMSLIGSQASNHDNCLTIATMEQQDSLLLSDCLARFVPKRNLPSNSLFAEIAMSFIGTPYLAGTLEKGTSEQLVVNLRAFDCTTLVETCLALQKTITSDSPTIDEFLSTLKKIRYRNGSIDGYPSRLHYFSEWISANEKNGHLHDLTCELHTQTRSKKINFMSQHPRAYRQLAEDSTLVAQFTEIEEKISELGGCFISKEEVSKYYNLFEDGMIVGITTNIDGLDFIHTGIIIHKDTMMYLLHASSEQAKVCLTRVPLHEYLKANKRQTGIVVLKVTGQK